jgi:hypothetical protein
MDLSNSNQGEEKAWLRLVALWVLAESVLGGLLHGLKLPVTGLLVGGSAMLCIMLIAGFFPKRGSVLNAMVLVMMMKFSLSPHSPFPAYLAVLFQGVLGEFLLRGRRFFLLKCLLFGFLGMMESAMQRLLVMVFISGTEIWEALDVWVKKVSFGPEHFSLWLATGYLILHALAGFFIGKLGFLLVSGDKGKSVRLSVAEGIPEIPASPAAKKKSLYGPWISLLAFLLYLQAEFSFLTIPFKIPGYIALVLRMVWLYGFLVYLLVPLVDVFFKKMLAKRADKYSSKLAEIRQILPEMLGIAKSAWSFARANQLGLSGFLALLVQQVIMREDEED